MPNTMILKKKHESVGDILRFWRQLKKISQLDLALDVDISSKHLSFVETGKSTPSRKLVLKIAQSLKLPLRHQNAVLKAAGYTSEFPEEPFDGEKMALIREALRRILEKHEPYPALVINSGYQILMKNSGFNRTVTHYAGANALKKYNNVYRLVFAEDGLKHYIKDWAAAKKFLLTRLWEEVVSTQNNELITLYEEIAAAVPHAESIHFQQSQDLPIMRLVLQKETVTTSLFSTVTTLGTPLDLTTQELRIESFFPADEETKDFFENPY